MDAILTVQLVKELHELYATNAHQNEKLNRLQDEHRYLQQLFGWNLFQMAKLGARSAIKQVSAGLANVAQRIADVQNLIASQRQLLEEIIADEQHTVCLLLIEQHFTIMAELEQLTEVEHQLKKKLFEICSSDEFHRMSKFNF